MIEKLNRECDLLKENCEYNAGIHYDAAESLRKKAFWLKFIPAILAAVSATLAQLGLWPSALTLVSALSATVTTLALVLQPEANSVAHLNAAKGFNCLKHELRGLRETFSASLSEQLHEAEVKMLHSRYVDLVRCSPPTTDKAFEKVRDRMQKSVHKPDFELRHK